MDDNFTLDKISDGQAARVVRIDTRGDIRRRLLDIGLSEGAIVSRVLCPFGGDPTAYLIRGAIIALRCEDACTICVSPIHTNH